MGADSGTGAQRQLYILSLLAQSKKGYTKDEIIRKLENIGLDVTQRVVARDMDSISSNFFVYEEEVAGRTVYKADKYAVKDMDLSVAQIISLYYMKEILASNEQSNIAKEALQMIDAILEKIPALSKAAFAQMEGMIKIVPEKSVQVEEIDDNILEEVQNAVTDKKTLKVWYMAFMGESVKERCFDPYILEIREGCWHVIGFCHLRQAIRDLRISRIKEIETTTKNFVVPTRFYENYSSTRFDKLAGDNICDVKIEFYEKAASLVEEYHTQKADKIIRFKDKVVFTKKTALTDDLIQWILSFGAQAKVVEPKELQDNIKERLLRAAELY